MRKQRAIASSILRLSFFFHLLTNLGPRAELKSQSFRVLRCHPREFDFPSPSLLSFQQMFFLWESSHQPHGTSQRLFIPSGKIGSSTFLERALSRAQGTRRVGLYSSYCFTDWFNRPGSREHCHRSGKLKWLKKIEFRVRASTSSCQVNATFMKPLYHTKQLLLVPFFRWILAWKTITLNESKLAIVSSAW